MVGECACSKFTSECKELATQRTAATNSLGLDLEGRSPTDVVINTDTLQAKTAALYYKLVNKRAATAETESVNKKKRME